MINYDVQTAYKSIYLTENSINIESLMILTEIENDIKKLKLMNPKIKKSLNYIKNALNNTNIEDVAIMNIISLHIDNIKDYIPENILEKFYIIIEKL